MTISHEQVAAARKLIFAYEAQEQAARDAERKAALEATRLVVAKTGVDLTEWATREWAQDKRAGYGRGMTRDRAIRYYTALAHTRLVQTLEAFNVDGVDFARLATKELTT